MTSRKFTVFIDDVSTVKPRSAPKPASTEASEEEAGPSSLSATEKENLHPLTGGRLRSSSAVGLKRKSSVLATKLHNPPDAKGSKRAPTLVPSKKRKVTSSSDGETEQSRPKARRLKAAARRKRSPELASIAEEKDERLARRLSQSDVDSRRYDLAVSPLANVSDTFARASPPTPKDSKRVSLIFLTLRLRWPSTHGYLRLVPSNQNSGITSALLQMQSPLSPLLPLSVGRPGELPSHLQHCLPQRGSEFTPPSRFHPRSGDPQNVNANDLLLPRSETCRRSSNLRSTICEPAISYRRPPNGPRKPYHCLLPSVLWPRLAHHLMFIPWTHVILSLSDPSYACPDSSSFSAPILTPLHRFLVHCTA